MKRSALGTEDAVEQDGPLVVRPAVVNRTERLALSAVTLFFGGAYALNGLFRHWRFDSGAYDLGIFDQAVWHLSRFEAPASTIRGFNNLLGDHFSPVIALFAPLYWIAPHAETLIVAQAALLAASIVPVFLFIRSRLPFEPACAMAVAYGFYWGIQRTADFDVHEMAFAPLAIASAILVMDRGRWRVFWIAVATIALVKEDLIPLAGGFGVYLILIGERRRGGILIASSIAAFALVVGIVVPALNDAHGYGYTSAYEGFLARPWLLPITLVTPAVKVRTALLWLLPFGLLSLASPLAVLIVPLALERLLSANETHWGTIFHYSAPIAPIVAMSAADGLSRISRRLGAAPHVVTAVAAAAVLLSSILPGHQPHWQLFVPDHYRLATFEEPGRTVLGLIPADASIVAQASIVPHMSQRRSIFVLDARAPDADYVVAASPLNPWPAANFDELRALLEERRRRGYTVLFEKNGWTVLHRQPAANRL